MSDTMNFGGGDGDIPEVGSSGSKGKSGGSASFTRSVTGKKVVGHNPASVDPRIYGGLDYNQGFSRRSHYEIGKDDRMTPAEAWGHMTRILAMFGLESAVEGDMFTFVSAIFAYHTVNSSSVLQPGRSTIKCLGNEFDYSRVVDLLGPDNRRFFRAYADEVRKENERILGCDPNDLATMQLREWIIQVAYERGLQRFPHLAHDSADACSRLTAAERSAVSGSKRMVLGTNVNTADSMVASGRVQGADKFDSTAGVSVEHASGAASGRRS